MGYEEKGENAAEYELADVNQLLQEYKKAVFSPPLIQKKKIIVDALEALQEKMKGNKE